MPRHNFVRGFRSCDKVVTYFLHALNYCDQMAGVARISRWVCTRLLPRAEDEWGLRLYVGDRDDLGGASKMHNFVRAFQSSDKVVVCLTREFIDDSDCMNYLATALDSSKPLSKYIFVLFDDIQPTSVPRRLRQLILPNSPSTPLTWVSRGQEWTRALGLLGNHARCPNAQPRPDEMSTSFRRVTISRDISQDRPYRLRT